MMWAFAWRNLMTRSMRTALAAIGLTIPVVAFLGMFSVSRGIRELMGSTLGSMQGLIVMSENAPTPIFSDLPADMAKSLRTLPGVGIVGAEVWRIAPPIEGRGGLASTAIGMLARSGAKGHGGLSSMVVIEGQDLAEHLKLKGAVFAMSMLSRERGGGRFLELGDVGKPNVVISTKIAGEYPNSDGSPRRVGQSIRIGNQDFAIVGLYNTGSLVTDVTIVMEIGVARKLMGVPERTVSTFAVEPKDPKDADALIERIEENLRGIRVQKISQFNLTVAAIMGKLEMFLLLAIGLAVLVGGVGIANTMLMSTSERYVEFGVMRTTGWSRWNILALVTAESCLLGLLSGTLGVSLAVALVLVVNRFLQGFVLELDPMLVGIGLVGATAIATVSGLYPAWQASKMTPMEAIRHGGEN